MNRLKVETRTLKALKWPIIIILALASLLPFYYMAMLSFIPTQELLTHPGRFYVPPDQFTLETYAHVLAPMDQGGQGFGGFMRNSAFVALATTLLTLLVVIPAAYAVSRVNFPGRKQVSLLYFGVYLFPAIILAIPLFVGFSMLGIRESYIGLIIVYIALTVPVSMHMLRNYLDTVPISLEEAARVDGCTRAQIMMKITLPLARPTIMSTALFIFMIAWNEYLFALLFLTAQDNLWTVSLGLAQLSGGIEVSKTILMAGSVLLTVPIILLYSVAERFLAEGLTAGAEKG
ncbi:MAG TPA: carbohydrate ABC transporter permease [Coriobacteriia bacterium]|nr:carbohydrate ABC transporter permease [Coriobacteriia bacterium]